MEFLAPYVESGRGVYFKADNGLYLSVIKKGPPPQDLQSWFVGSHLIEATKVVKDPWCKFNIEIIDENHIYIYSPIDKKYLSRINIGEVNYIQSAKTSPDEYCKFKVFKRGEKIILKADNGKFISRIDRDWIQNNIEAAKGEIDEQGKFILEEGKRSQERVSPC